jgi:hypothetical protein
MVTSFSRYLFQIRRGTEECWITCAFNDIAEPPKFLLQWREAYDEWVAMRTVIKDPDYHAFVEVRFIEWPKWLHKSGMKTDSLHKFKRDVFRMVAPTQLLAKLKSLET